MNEHSPVDTQSGLRKTTSRPLHKLMTIVDEKLPEITPNMLTYAGTGLVALGCISLGAAATEQLQQYQTLLNTVGFANIGLGSVLDGVDGTLARIKAARGEHDTVRGQIIDAVEDRKIDTFLAMLRTWLAYQNGSEFAQVAALTAWVTNYSPSYYRAWAEAQGAQVHEGKGLKFLGSRGGRMVLNLVGIVAGIAGLPDLQGATDTVSTGFNLITARARQKQGVEAQKDFPDGVPDSLEYKVLHDKAKLGEERRVAYIRPMAAGVAGAAVTAAGVIYSYLPH